MLKRILFAVVPMVLFAGAVSADDDLLTELANMDDAKITATDVVDNDATIDEDDLGQADVDKLMGDDDKDEDEDAVSACFRRVGYGYGYGGYSSYSYGYSSYNYHCYTPTYHVYRPVTYTYHVPVVRYYTPIYTSYWGCY